RHKPPNAPAAGDRAAVFVPPSVHPASKYSCASKSHRPLPAGPSSQWPWPATPLQNQARKRAPHIAAASLALPPHPHPHLHISATRPPPRALRRARRDPWPRHSPEGAAVPARHSTRRPRISRAAPTVQDLVRDPKAPPFVLP
ncbi:hypothetical protein PVAP13_2KG217730, partial [Panicum virgatum]